MKGLRVHHISRDLIRRAEVSSSEVDAQVVHIIAGDTKSAAENGCVLGCMQAI